MIDRFWIYVVYLLYVLGDGCWNLFGWMLGICWTCLGSFETCLGHVEDMFWACLGYLFGHVLDMFWINLEQY